jgi:hypothetical protein
LLCSAALLVVLVLVLLVPGLLLLSLPGLPLLSLPGLLLLSLPGLPLLSLLGLLLLLLLLPLLLLVLVLRSFTGGNRSIGLDRTMQAQGSPDKTLWSSAVHVGGGGSKRSHQHRRKRTSPRRLAATTLRCGGGGGHLCAKPVKPSGGSTKQTTERGWRCPASWCSIDSMRGGTISVIAVVALVLLLQPQVSHSQASRCRYTNDGECDEPDLCPEGSDVADCSRHSSSSSRRRSSYPPPPPSRDEDGFDEFEDEEGSIGSYSGWELLFNLIVFFILLFFPCIVFGAAWCTCIRQHNTLGTRAARPPARPPGCVCSRLRAQLTASAPCGR